ncbi:hypothetical protein [Pseudogracilibacillus auburnensis]|uniref:hypothetical protein n=1 Tax=Pseudogracilibacillus auburnensis TaxID=1494959 RepID=UPI001A97BCC7|nr:hypothetical protein [Pseudogracilibacillus auburnensis]MBO1003275.1 hypothetical protein [Pseudogracilibacillus auburnensis]
MLRVFLYPFIIMLYIIAQLTEGTTLLYIVGIFANITVIVSLFHARGLYLYSGIIFYVIGMILFLLNDLPWQAFFLQFDTMLGILALFLLLPFLNSLILVGRYDKHLSSLLQYNINHVGDLYKRGSFVSHILGLFLNIATVPLVLKSLHKSLNIYPTSITDRFYTTSILRAYALCLMWSPMEIMIIKSLEITNVDYLFVFPILFLLTISILFIDTTIGKRKYGPLKIGLEQSHVSLEIIFKKMKDLLVLLLFLVVSVTLLNRIVQQGYLFSLVLMIIPISFIWAIKIRKVRRYIIHSKQHWQMKTKGLANYFFMFLSAGFFVNMVANTKLLTVLQYAFVHFSEQLLFLFCLIGLYFFITSFIGFHPLVSIVLLAEILQPIIANIPSIPLSIVLIICSLSTVMYSPFNVSISILASEINLHPYRIGVWNIAFSLLLMVISIVFAYTIHIVGGFFT